MGTEGTALPELRRALKSLLANINKLRVESILLSVGPAVNIVIIEARRVGTAAQEPVGKTRPPLGLAGAEFARLSLQGTRGAEPETRRRSQEARK